MRISLHSAAAFLALTLLVTPDAAQAQGGILGRARRAVERGVDRAADRAQNRVEDEAENQADQALTNALGEVGSGISQALGFSGSNTGSLENGDLVDTQIMFEPGSARLTSDSRRSLEDMGQRLAPLNDRDLRDIRGSIAFKGYTHSGVSQQLAQQRANAARDVVLSSGNLRRNASFRVTAGTARGDSDLGIQLNLPRN